MHVILLAIHAKISARLLQVSTLKLCAKLILHYIESLKDGKQDFHKIIVTPFFKIYWLK